MTGTVLAFLDVGHRRSERRLPPLVLPFLASPRLALPRMYFFWSLLGRLTGGCEAVAERAGQREEEGEGGSGDLNLKKKPGRRKGCYNQMTSVGRPGGCRKSGTRGRKKDERKGSQRNKSSSLSSLLLNSYLHFWCCLLLLLLFP